MQTQRSTGWRVLSDYGGPFHTGLSGKNACSFRSLRRGPKLTAARRRSIQMVERPLEASRGHVTHTFTSVHTGAGAVVFRSSAGAMTHTLFDCEDPRAAVSPCLPLRSNSWRPLGLRRVFLMGHPSMAMIGIDKKRFAER